MDINEFEKQMPPKTKRSRLEPFRAQIFELKAKGYANWQISKFLEDNGLSVSQEAVRKFIKSREGQPIQPTENKVHLTELGAAASPPGEREKKQHPENQPPSGDDREPASSDAVRDVLNAQARENKLGQYGVKKSILKKD